MALTTYPGRVATSIAPVFRRKQESVCTALYGTQTPRFAQQLDSPLIASMKAALVHSEGGKAVTFGMERKGTNRDPKLIRLREALLTTNQRNMLPDGS